MNFFNSLFLIYIDFWIPEVIQGLFLNPILYLLTFLSGAYLFSTEFIVSRKMFVAKLIFFYQVSKYWASLYWSSPTQNFPGQNLTSPFQKNFQKRPYDLKNKSSHFDTLQYVLHVLPCTFPEINGVLQWLSS